MMPECAYTNNRDKGQSPWRAKSVMLTKVSIHDAIQARWAFHIKPGKPSL